MKVIFYALLLIVCMNISAQDSISTIVNTQEYERIIKDYKFEKEKWSLVPKEFEQSEKQIAEDKLPSWGSSGIFDGLAYVLIIVIIGFIIYLIFSRIKIEEKIIIKEQDLDEIENIEEVDVVSGYENALKNGNYRLAIRMQFIKLLQHLQETKIIDWKNEKTNRTYLNEIKDPQLKKNFRFLSSIFERTWYGNKNIDFSAFQIANTHFLTFFKMVDNE